MRSPRGPGLAQHSAGTFALTPTVCPDEYGGLVLTWCPIRGRVVLVDIELGADSGGEGQDLAVQVPAERRPAASGRCR